jgi:SAM-dependent methyltransferase
MMAESGHCQRVLFSAACERNKEPILAVLRQWLELPARVLEVGSGSGQHAVFFCTRIAGLTWQASDRPEALADLAAGLAGVDPAGLAPGSRLVEPLALDVRRPEQWPRRSFDAVFSANTCHIMPASALPQLLAGTARVLRPGGLLLLYGPFHDGGVHNAPSNAAFDAHLRSLDPAMGVRDAVALTEQARQLGLDPIAEIGMPAHNRLLILQRPAGPPARSADG